MLYYSYKICGGYHDEKNLVLSLIGLALMTSCTPNNRINQLELRLEQVELENRRLKERIANIQDSYFYRNLGFYATEPIGDNPDLYREVVDKMNITIDSAQYVPERDKLNLAEPKYVIEIKYHYNEHEGTSLIGPLVMQGYQSEKISLEKYSFSNVDTVKREDGVVYCTKHYSTDTIGSILILEFMMKTPYEYVGIHSIETNIER